MQVIDSYLDCSKEIDGKWVVARPLPNMNWKYRIRCAFAVLIGKAEAVTFYKQ
jgi:hypothetical protein